MQLKFGNRLVGKIHKLETGLFDLICVKKKTYLFSLKFLHLETDWLKMVKYTSWKKKCEVGEIITPYSKQSMLETLFDLALPIDQDHIKAVIPDVFGVRLPYCMYFCSRLYMSVFFIYTRYR